MSGVQGLADLDAVGAGLLDWHRAGDGLALDVLHHQVAAAVVLPDVVQRADVRVVQRGDGAGLALEAFRERALDRLDGDVAVEPDVVGAVYLAHPSSAGRFDDFVGTKSSAWG